MTMTKFTTQELVALDLNEEPFSVSADPRFLYLTEQHKAHLSRLQDNIMKRLGLCVIEGPIGAGKTTLARRLYELCTQDDALEPVYIHTAIYSTRMMALRDIVTHFCPDSGRSYLDKICNFEQYLIDLLKQNKNPVLIIDDAQLMAPDSLQTIQALLNFDISSKLIQIILFGQQEIHKSFSKNPALLNRAIFWRKLDPLTFAETVQMIHFRLTVAGRFNPLFTEEAIGAIYEASKGVPRTLMVICHETLHIMVTKGHTEAQGTDVRQAVEIYNERYGSQDQAPHA